MGVTIRESGLGIFQTILAFLETIQRSCVYTGCFVTTSGADCTPKNNEKKSHKYVSYLSSFMRL